MNSVKTYTPVGGGAGESPPDRISRAEPVDGVIGEKRWLDSSIGLPRRIPMSGGSLSSGLGVDQLTMLAPFAVAQS